MVVAVSLFLLFDFAALGLNVGMSVKIEREAVGINLAGRQRMLSQRMAKVLLQLEDAQRAGEPLAEPMQELALTTELFDQTLQGFWAGRETEGGQGERVFLAPVTQAHTRQLVAQAREIWAPYRELSLQVLSADAAQLPVRLPAVVGYLSGQTWIEPEHGELTDVRASDKAPGRLVWAASFRARGGAYTFTLPNTVMPT